MNALRKGLLERVRPEPHSAAATAVDVLVAIGATVVVVAAVHAAAADGLVETATAKSRRVSDSCH